MEKTSTRISSLPDTDHPSSRALTALMSALGHKQTNRRVGGMSALSPKPDIRKISRSHHQPDLIHLRFTPKSRHQLLQTECLLRANSGPMHCNKKNGRREVVFILKAFPLSSFSANRDVR